MISFVDVKAQNAELRKEIGAAVGKVVNSGAFILGPEVDEFERDFASYIGVDHAVGVACGLDALTLTLRALGIGIGDEVLVPANSFVASAQAVSQVGALPVFVDCLPGTYLMDVADAKAAVGPTTKAVMPVHLYGQCADMAAVMGLAHEYNLTVIEDACQAHGAARAGSRAGSVGDAGSWSFYPAKNLGAFGDGGMVTTDNQYLAEKIRRYRNYGQAAKYDHVEFGVNSRLDTIQAAVLGCKLKQLDRWNAHRRAWAVTYKELFADSEIIETPQTALGNEHVWHLYVVRIRGLRDRPGLLAAARNKGVPLGVHYPTPIHMQPPYAPLHELGRRAPLPNAEAGASEIVSLPMHPHLTVDEVTTVADVVLDLAPRFCPGRER